MINLYTILFDNENEINIDIETENYNTCNIANIIVVDIDAEKAEILRILAADDQELLDAVIKDDSTDVEESINIMEGNLERLTGVEANRRITN